MVQSAGKVVGDAGDGYADDGSADDVGGVVDTCDYAAHCHEYRRDKEPYSPLLVVEIDNS